MLRFTCAGWRLDHNDPRPSAISPVGWPLHWESHLNKASVLVCSICLMFHDTACQSASQPVSQSAAYSAHYRAWLRIANVRPLTDVPSVTSVGLPSRNPHQGSLLHVPQRIKGQGCPGLCYVICSAVVHRVHDGRSWSVSIVEVLRVLSLNQATVLALEKL